MPEILAGPGPSAPAHTKTRWMLLTQEPIDGYYLLIWADGIEGERVSNTADVPRHPVEQTSAVSDHATKGAQSYSVTALLATPLEGDNVAPRRNGQVFTAAYGDVPVVAAPPVAASRDSVGGVTYNDRGASLLAALDRVLGVPLDIYSPRYGKLRSFVLTSYNDQRDGTSRVEVTLSLQQIQRATVSRVPVPALPRARNQDVPSKTGAKETSEEELENTGLDDISAAQRFKNAMDPNGAGVFSQILHLEFFGGLAQAITGVFGEGE